jgi:NAD-dependent dihydropyrimidine dehydrogenase PreA subunit
MSTKVCPPTRVMLCSPANEARESANRTLEIVRLLLERGYSVCRTSAQPGETAIPLTVEIGTIHTNPKRQRGNDLATSLTLRVSISDNRGQYDAAPHVDPDDVSPAEVADQVDRIVQADGQSKPNWKPWFPVIDRNRCTNCMQCLSFCLFDVYAVTPDGKIAVANPANCKTDCPACSRVCPEVAIIFPKYRWGPMNGEEPGAGGSRREVVKVDISALLGGDVYSMLRDRSQRARSRFSKERNDDRALEERRRCLAKLQQDVKDLDIPPEVMAALPSPEEIREKAQAARRKAQAALAQRSE